MTRQERQFGNESESLRANASSWQRNVAAICCCALTHWYFYYYYYYICCYAQCTHIARNPFSPFPPSEVVQVLISDTSWPGLVCSVVTHPLLLHLHSVNLIWLDNCYTWQHFRPHLSKERIEHLPADQKWTWVKSDYIVVYTDLCQPFPSLGPICNSILLLFYTRHFP